MLFVECFTFSYQNTAVSIFQKLTHAVSKLFAAEDCQPLTVLTKQV